MKKKLILLSLVAAMFMTGCKNDEGEQSQNNENNTNENTDNGGNTNNGENNNNDNNNSENNGGENNNGENSNTDKPPVKPPVIITNSFEEALKKDYSNMTVNYALNGMETGKEYGNEYYCGNNDFVAVLDASAAEVMGSTANAWSFYTLYEGKSYTYWKGSNWVTEGWISNGRKGIEVGIKLAYFYMPFFLQNITKDDVDSVMGAYVVKDSSIAKVMSGLQFTYMTNIISYIDIFVDDNGYI